VRTALQPRGHYLRNGCLVMHNLLLHQSLFIILDVPLIAAFRV
jgi:hypothetical protein